MESAGQERAGAGCATAPCCCQMVALHFGNVFQTSKPDFPLKLRENLVNKLPYIWIGIFSLENIKQFLPP